MKTHRAIFKLTRRSIRTFFGRYLALFLLLFLSTGFFAGLKITKPAMQRTCDDYLSRQKLFDIRILSSNFFCPPTSRPSQTSKASPLPRAVPVRTPW